MISSNSPEAMPSWGLYPPLRNALAAGVIALAGFLLAHLGLVGGVVETAFYGIAIPLGAFHGARSPESSRW